MIRSGGLRLLPALLLLAGCGADPDAARDRTPAAVPGQIAPPTREDPVAPWERQWLPPIDAHMRAGRLDSVIALCRQSLDEDSTRIELYNLMASAYASQGQYASATEALQTAVRLSPRFAVGWANLGGLHAGLGRYAEAVPYLERAAVLEPTRSGVRRRLGEAYLNTARPEEAAAQFAEALAALPEDATLTLALGKAQEASGRDAEALASYLRAGALDPGYGDAHDRAADLARRLGQTAAADSCTALRDHLQQIAGGDAQARATLNGLRAAIANAPEAAIHHARLGGFYLYHGYLAQALPLFDRAAGLEPDNAALLNEFGGLLAQKGHMDQALSYYRRALDLLPDYGPALLNAGGVLAATGRHAEALPYFEAARAADPEDAGAHYYLAVCQRSLGRQAEARQSLEKARDLAGDGTELRKQIEALLASTDG